MQPTRFERGVFTVSLDFELIWGRLDEPGYRGFLPLCRVEREEVVGRLLDLFAEFEIGATWCTVGHLFLDRCRTHGHGLVPSSPLDRLRMRRDPRASEAAAPLYYGRQLVEMIRRCPVPQEIGSHSFSHVLFGDPRTTGATARSEHQASIRAAAEMGLELRSFVFPRNAIGHVGLLPEYGFTSFRGQDPVWYEQAQERRWYHRAGHLADVLLVRTPPAVFPRFHEAGLWEIPGSMLYTPSFGVRRFVPVSMRVARARRGLRRAVRERRLFHLWFHPTDLTIRRRAMLDGLRRIFETVRELREAGQLDVLGMGALAARMTGAATPAQAMALEPALQ